MQKSRLDLNLYNRFGRAPKYVLLLILCISLMACNRSPAPQDSFPTNESTTGLNMTNSSSNFTIEPITGLNITNTTSNITIKEPTGPKIVYTLPNGGFENGTTGWYVRHGYRLDTTTAHSGKASIKSVSTFYNNSIDPSQGDARAIWPSNRIYVKPGQKIIVRAWMKTEGVNPSCPPHVTRNCGKDAGLRVGIDFKTIQNATTRRAINGEFVKWGSDWTYREINATVQEGEERITLWLQGKPYNFTAAGWFDDIELEVIQP